jgi:sulfonate transport system ATP-binding protein
MDTNLFDPVLTADVLASSSGCAASLLGVTRAFGGQSVLRGIDLAIPAGQFVAIVGRSGCGKSTLLRLLAGLDQPSSGRIEIDGRSIGWRDQVRLMFQEPRLLPWQRIAANVAVGLPGTLPRDDRRRAAQAALSRVGLADRAGEWPSVLSGGQKQRVALARALASHPRMLAFDEPLGALDALTRIEMQCLIEQVWLEKGFTAIVVTHDVSEAVALADRILLLDSGRIAMDVPVAIPRPRRRGDPAAAAIEGRILDRLLGR